MACGVRNITYLRLDRGGYIVDDTVSRSRIRATMNQNIYYLPVAKPVYARVSMKHHTAEVKRDLTQDDKHKAGLPCGRDMFKELDIWALGWYALRLLLSLGIELQLCSSLDMHLGLRMWTY